MELHSVCFQLFAKGYKPRHLQNRIVSGNSTKVTYVRSSLQFVPTADGFTHPLGFTANPFAVSGR
jgi:hypothetical protein